MKKYFITILFLILAVISLAGCLNKAPQEPIDSPATTVKTERPETALFTMAEISTHNNETDCWLLISGRVYNVTSMINSHPGGKAILQGCGQDATILFSTRPMGSGTNHSDKAKTSLENYYIGNLASNEK